MAKSNKLNKEMIICTKQLKYLTSILIIFAFLQMALAVMQIIFAAAKLPSQAASYAAVCIMGIFIVAGFIVCVAMKYFNPEWG